MKSECCLNPKEKSADKKMIIHPEHFQNLSRLKKVEGQVKGIMKMIEDRRYCVDILIQIRAVASALNAIEMDIFEKHIGMCVSEAMQSKDKAAIQIKTEELISLISKRIKL